MEPIFLKMITFRLCNEAIILKKSKGIYKPVEDTIDEEYIEKNNVDLKPTRKGYKHVTLGKKHHEPVNIHFCNECEPSKQILKVIHVKK